MIFMTCTFYVLRKMTKLTKLLHFLCILRQQNYTNNNKANATEACLDMITEMLVKSLLKSFKFSFSTLAPYLRVVSEVARLQSSQ